ncbi:MAG: helix-turn-helix transcriptional regulator [Clostridia bacterium]|nr:helix-turn-helix transcriptional regulator [Clostridia bacterium]
MLIEYGNTVVKPTWELNEETPTGYSRIYYVLEGDLTYEAADQRKALKLGCLYALPSTAPYRVWRNPEKDFACTYLHVAFSKYRVKGLIERPVEDGSCLGAFVAAVSRAIQEKRIELLEQLAEGFSFFLREDENFVQNSQMLTLVQRHIVRHISEELTIESLSQLFNYHPNYFIRLFRRETGYTPYQYIVQQRMQYAVTQLNKGLPNEEVCLACGYTDSSTFTRAFRKYYGVAPQKYRKGFRKP